MWPRDWSSDVCSSDLGGHVASVVQVQNGDARCVEVVDGDQGVAEAIQLGSGVQRGLRVALVLQVPPLAAIGEVEAEKSGKRAGADHDEIVLAVESARRGGQDAGT